MLLLVVSSAVLAEWRETECNDGRSGGPIFMDRHTIACNSTKPNEEPLQGFALDTCPRQSDMKFNMSCDGGFASTPVCRVVETGCSFNRYQNIKDFDFNVSCDLDEVMTYWKLTDDGCNPNLAQIEYGCCADEFHTPTDHQTSCEPVGTTGKSDVWIGHNVVCPDFSYLQSWRWTESVCSAPNGDTEMAFAYTCAVRTTTQAPPTDAPPTDAPPTSVPTDAPPTGSPPTSAPPTDAPPTNAPPTASPPTSAPPTDSPPTDSPPTSAPP
ncbi:hypothetical protein DIPPA_50585, partial [Diplonema papillatum]